EVLERTHGGDHVQGCGTPGGRRRLKVGVDGAEHDTLSIEGCTSSPACRRRSRRFVFLPGHEMLGVLVATRAWNSSDGWRDAMTPQSCSGRGRTERKTSPESQIFISHLQGGFT